MPMIALITGISGFVGAGLARYLLAQKVEVHGIVRQSSNLWRLEDIRHELTLHIGDLLDEHSTSAVLQKVKPNVVFHLAVYGAYSSQKDTERILSTTVKSTLHLLTASRENGVSMFVNTGSSSEYGTKNHPMREDELVDPNSYYAVGKVAQTHLCRQFSRQDGLPTITLRLFSVYGPYEEPGRLVPTVIGNALSGNEIIISDPKVARDFIYIDDVARALHLVSQRHDLSGEVINLGSGIQHTLGEMANAIIAQTKSQSAFVVGGNEKRSFDTYTWVADTTKIESLLDFCPSYNMDEGVSKSVEWYKKNASYYKKK